MIRPALPWWSHNHGVLVPSDTSTPPITAWAMITFANVDGIRYLSNLGGLPATLLVLVVLGSLGVIILRHRELDATGGGRPPSAPPPADAG